MANSILRDKSKEFAKAIVFLCREMKENRKETVLINQLLRCATSIGANLHEAQYAQSTKDFISKIEIAQKECYETEYWLDLLYETNCMSEERYHSIQNDSHHQYQCKFHSKNNFHPLLFPSFFHKKSPLL